MGDKYKFYIAQQSSIMQNISTVLPECIFTLVTLDITAYYLVLGCSHVENGIFSGLKVLRSLIDLILVWEPDCST